MKPPANIPARPGSLLERAEWPCVFAGWAVMFAGVYLRNWWLLPLAFALTFTGCRLPPFLVRRRRGGAEQADRPVAAEEQAKEDAAVAALERYMEAEARFREMGEYRDWPSQRLH